MNFFLQKLTLSTRHWTSYQRHATYEVMNLLGAYIFEMETAAMLVWETNTTFSSLPCASVSNRVLVQNFLYNDEFNWHENKHTAEKHFSTMVSHKDSFRHRGERQLGSNLFCGSSTLFLCKHFPLFRQLCMFGLRAK